jgi:TrmH family RNA methyltransferase
LAGQRSARIDEGAFVVEGPTLLAEALAAGAPVTDVFVADRVATEVDIDVLLQRALASGASLYEIDESTLRRSADTVSPQGVMSVVERRPAASSVLAATDLVLVLVEVTDPGNAGTLVRAAEAAGAGAVVATAGTTDLFGPKTVRASAGAVFHVPLVVGNDAAEVLDDLASTGHRRVATRVDGGVPYDSVALDRPVALIVGNEAHGLPAELEAHVDDWVTIPMAGRSESLNVAMAGSVLCFEALRQRRAAEQGGGNRLDPGRGRAEGSSPP